MSFGIRRQDKIVRSYHTDEQRIAALHHDLLTTHQAVNLLAGTDDITIDLLKTLIINDGATAGKYLDGSPRMFCVTIGEACCEECREEEHCNQGRTGLLYNLITCWDWMSDAQWREPDGEIQCSDSHNSKFKTVARLLTPEVMKLVTRISLTICCRDPKESEEEHDLPGFCSALQNIKRYIPNLQVMEINYSCSCQDEGRLPTHPEVPKRRRKRLIGVSGPHVAMSLGAASNPPPLSPESIIERQRTSYERTGWKDAFELRQDLVKDRLAYIPSPKLPNPFPRFSKGKQRELNLSEDTMRRRKGKAMGLDGGSSGGLCEAPNSSVELHSNEDTLRRRKMRKTILAGESFGSLFEPLESSFELQLRNQDPEQKPHSITFDGSQEASLAEQAKMEGISTRDFAPILRPSPRTWFAFIKTFKPWTRRTKKIDSKKIDTKETDSRRIDDKKIDNKETFTKENVTKEIDTRSISTTNSEIENNKNEQTAWPPLLENFRKWILRKSESSTHRRKSKFLDRFADCLLYYTNANVRKERKKAAEMRRKAMLMVWRLEKNLPEGKRIRHLHGELWKYYKQQLWLEGGRVWWN